MSFRIHKYIIQKKSAMSNRAIFYIKDKKLFKIIKICYIIINCDKKINLKGIR